GWSRRRRRSRTRTRAEARPIRRWSAPAPAHPRRSWGERTRKRKAGGCRSRTARRSSLPTRGAAAGAAAHAVEVRRDRRGVHGHRLALAFGRLEHDVVTDLLDDRAQAARAGAPPQAVLCARSQALVGEAQGGAADLPEA